MAVTHDIDLRQFNKPPALAQRLEALELANRTRSQRRQLKADLKHGRIAIADVLADPPDYALTMRLTDLLLALPKVGMTKINRLYRKTGLSPSKRVGNVTAAQRYVILPLLAPVPDGGA